MLKKIPVICSEQKRGGSFKIGIIELTRPEAMNALDTECYKIIETKLRQWRESPEISAVVIYSENSKAFCAGGDVKVLTQQVQINGLEKAEEFFTCEYFVDLLVREFKKPVIAIADGITMGGGLGLINGASHRLVTERTIMAMPELAIGLFPDVGATNFLAQLPNQFGLFMGLTGARINGTDALTVGLADFYFHSKLKSKLLVDIMGLPWVSNAEKNINLVTNYFLDIFKENPQSPNCREYLSVEKIFEHKNILTLQAEFTKLSVNNDFLKDCQNRFNAGSPLSQQLFFSAYKKHQKLNMRTTLVTEWDMALKACQGDEFFEGVRAVLIDKDQKPQWGYTSSQAIENLDQFFISGRKNLLREKISEFFDKV